MRWFVGSLKVCLIDILVDSDLNSWFVYSKFVDSKFGCLVVCIVVNSYLQFAWRNKSWLRRFWRRALSMADISILWHRTWDRSIWSYGWKQQWHTLFCSWSQHDIWIEKNLPKVLCVAYAKITTASRHQQNEGHVDRNLKYHNIIVKWSRIWTTHLFMW